MNELEIVRQKYLTRKPQNLCGYIAYWHTEKKTLVYEHRLVMELMIGRELVSDEFVHHKNKDKRDNRPENLELTNNKDHTSLHEREKGHMAVEVDCDYCGKVFSIRGERRKNQKLLFCSLNCMGLKSRKVERPSVEQLKLDISLMPWTGIGKKYRVSDNAVRKWARRYGII